MITSVLVGLACGMVGIVAASLIPDEVKKKAKIKAQEMKNRALDAVSLAVDYLRE